MRTILFPRSAQALSFRRRHASPHDPLSFGTFVSSVDAWVADSWLVRGDGRAIATGMQRRMAFLSVLDGLGRRSLPATVGMAGLLMRLADEALGSSAFEALLRGGADIPESDRALVEAVEAYEALLDARGLVDPGRACAIMANGCDASEGAVVYDASLPAARRELLHASFSSVEERVSVEGSISRVAETVKPRFAFPSGRYAEPKLLGDIIAAHAREGSVLVTARHPYGSYRKVAPALARRGISCAVRARAPFFETAFGRAYRAASRVVSAERGDLSACADFLLNPFSEVPVSKAYELDAAFRADRLLTRDDCLERLRGASRSFEYFEGLVESPDSDALLGYFEDRARCIGESEAAIAEHIGAVGALREAMASARLFGLDAEKVASVLEGVRVDVSRGDAAGGCDVLIADALQPDAFDFRAWRTVVMCDMDNASFPAKNADDAAYALAERIGAARPRHALDDLRRAFVAAATKAREHLVIERCLNDASADPTYPAATVEEFVDRYRDDPTDSSEIDNRYALPERLMEGLLERGEEGLYENSSVGDSSQVCDASCAPPSLSEVSSDDARRMIVLPRIAKGGRLLDAACFSASQIESYLECPQKWFALRRLRLDDIDEGFGAVEMGEFSHASLEAFYRRFQEEVAAKVRPETVPAARAIMHEVVEAQKKAQFEKKPSSNRLVPVSVFEKCEVDDLGSLLEAYPQREAALLPGFAPFAFEYDIPADKAVDYAGCKLMGTIDRIDVDEKGQAVVIDYKSSLSADYDLYEPKSKGGAMREGKVQALVYAQAIRRTLGFDVVGALYVGYGRNPKVAGALASSVEPLHVPGLRAETCVYRGERGPDFADLLDAVEQRIEGALGRLMRGDIAPDPSTPHACSFCPELSCPQRKG